MITLLRNYRIVYSLRTYLRQDHSFLFRPSKRIQDFLQPVKECQSLLMSQQKIPQMYLPYFCCRLPSWHLRHHLRQGSPKRRFMILQLELYSSFLSHHRPISYANRYTIAITSISEGGAPSSKSSQSSSSSLKELDKLVSTKYLDIKRNFN